MAYVLMTFVWLALNKPKEPISRLLDERYRALNFLQSLAIGPNVVRPVMVITIDPCPSRFVGSTYRTVCRGNCNSKVIIQYGDNPFSYRSVHLSIAKLESKPRNIEITRDRQIIVEFIEKALERADIDLPGRLDENLGPGLTNLQPLFFMRAKFIRGEAASPWVARIVSVNLSVTVETYWNSVLNIMIIAFRRLYDMISFDFCTAKPVADTASPVALDKQRGNFVAVETGWHVEKLRSPTGHSMKPWVLGQRTHLNLHGLGHRLHQSLRNKMLSFISSPEICATILNRRRICSPAL